MVQGTTRKNIQDSISELRELAKTKEPIATNLNRFFEFVLHNLSENLPSGSPAVYHSLQSLVNIWISRVRDFVVQIMDDLLDTNDDTNDKLYDFTHSESGAGEIAIIMKVSKDRSKNKSNFKYNPSERLYLIFQEIQSMFDSMEEEEEQEKYDRIDIWLQCRIFEYYTDIINKITLPPLLKQNLILEFEKFLSLEKTFKEYII